jgi:hypothetical protein
MATKTDTTPTSAPAPKAAVKKAAKKVATKKAAAPKTKRAQLDPKLVAEAIAMLKTKKGATYSEIATALKLKSKGDAPHQSPQAQVRALVRDKVRADHAITDGDFDSERGGQVYLIK